MRALSLWQPWATLVAVGAKRIETRSWRTSYRGPLAIHASQRWTKDQVRMLNVEPFNKLLRAHEYYFAAPWYRLPFRAIVATCELRDIVPTAGLSVSETERALGDYRAGRWAWMLDNIELITPPIQYRGSLGLWEYQKLPVQGGLP